MSSRFTNHNFFWFWYYEILLLLQNTVFLVLQIKVFLMNFSNYSSACYAKCRLLLSQITVFLILQNKVSPNLAKYRFACFPNYSFSCFSNYHFACVANNNFCLFYKILNICLFPKFFFFVLQNTVLPVLKITVSLVLTKYCLACS